MIINIASIGGLRGVPNISIYSAAKAGLIALSDGVRLEVKPYGIHVLRGLPWTHGRHLLL